MVMKKITFSADKTDVVLARESARRRNTTLDELFREWLREVAAGQERARAYQADGEIAVCGCRPKVHTGRDE
jgi:hypothetical protein